MVAARVLVWALVAAIAASRRKACRLSCDAAIAQCVADGGRRKRCKRQTLRSCRRDGVQACDVLTTTTSTSAGATTSIPTGTTIVPDTTTTTADGATTSTADQSATSIPAATTTSTTFPEVHGCTGDNAVDRTAPSADRTVTFAPYQYRPKCLRIAVGQAVTFSGTFAEHPLVGGEVVGFDATPDPSSPITPTSSGTTKDVDFPSAGAFPFYCDFHGITQGMVGAVLVSP